MISIEEWVESQEFQIRLDGNGKIIDYLDDNIRHENKPEERIRQKTVRILVDEFGYDKKQISVERGIQIGRETKRADIVIYNSSNAKEGNRQGEIYLIAEIKAPNVKMPDNQLISYMSATSAQGGFWTNGDKIYFYRKHSDGKIKETIGIPRNGEPWDAVGKYKKSDLVTPVDLKLAFRRCHNAMYRSGIDSEDVALDMTRILLAKHEDEESADETCKFRMTQEEYDDPEKRHAACQRVRTLFNAVKERYPDVFSENEEITVSDDKLAIVISQLQQYAFLDSPYDVIGTAYEIYVASHLKGERGQYFTNRLVISMMVKMVDANEKSIILDPSCGSGGFLITAMNHILRRVNESKRTDAAKAVMRANVVHNLYGIDISPKLVKISKANMLLGKDGHGGIVHADSLNGIDTLPATFQERCGFRKPTIILSNPPFGSGNDIRIKNRLILERFEIGHAWTHTDSGDIIYDEKLNDGIGVAPELLFLEQYLKWVKEDGGLI
ncbi:MAG: type I restriction enzyme HsdR N-terminal domain-containing protein, partial [Muribaculaceae bacterium]|nr:type I restriction enzyme HsdR N-terminal domain-containing protein [Muribaculaceae bacterium]